MAYRVEVVKINQFPEAEYIGRPSVLCNPWPLSSIDTRTVVCDRYEDYFQDKIQQNDPAFIKELLRLHRIGKQKGVLKIGCFCRPEKRCHGDTIKHFLESNFELLEMWEDGFM